jgi:UPF0176 protein
MASPTTPPAPVDTMTTAAIQDETLNAAFYLFADLAPLDALRDAIKAWCVEAELLGTVILADEGINGMLAGPPDVVRAAIAFIKATRPALADLPVKYSASQGPSFARLDVKIKPEIVTMRVPGVDATHTAPRLDPHTLRDWLRSGEPVTLVDVRNDFECQLGTFRGAINPRTTAFHEFPEFALAHREQLQRARLVTFCTGGIRCEKATSWLLDQGFDEVYQLDGGILNYFQQIQDADKDWDGQLFVFDNRTAVDTHLRPAAPDDAET